MYAFSVMRKITKLLNKMNNGMKTYCEHTKTCIGQPFGSLYT